MNERGFSVDHNLGSCCAFVYRDYLGGYGLGGRLLCERMLPGVDPLGPESVLGFVPGLLTGTGISFSGRLEELTLSACASGHPPLEAGPTEGVSLDIEAMTRDYFRAMGWDEVTGIPPREQLESLGLAGIIGEGVY